MPSTKQIQLIQVAKRKLHLTDEDYRAILDYEAGVDSCKDLDYIGFDRVMKRFEQLGFQSTSKKENYGYRPNMATPAQVRYIRSLWQDYTGDTVNDNDKSLNAWLDKFHKVSAVRMISIQKAAKVIPALKHMSSRAKAAKAK